LTDLQKFRKFKKIRFTKKLDMKKADVKSNFERAKMLNKKYIASHQIYRRILKNWALCV